MASDGFVTQKDAFNQFILSPDGDNLLLTFSGMIGTIIGGNRRHKWFLKVNIVMEVKDLRRNCNDKAINWVAICLEHLEIDASVSIIDMPDRIVTKIMFT